MKNYICINGNKTELTEEQLKQLGIEIPKVNPFERANKRTPFYFITNKGKVEYGVEVADFHCNELHKVANYCTDKSLLEQQALHETLNRLLWRYSMEHDGDKIDWGNNDTFKWYVYHHSIKNTWHTDCVSYTHDSAIFFHSRATAEAAIEKIIKPFMKAHPEFKW